MRDGKPILANYDPDTGEYTPVTGFDPLPTADIRNRQDATKSIVPLLKGMRGMSERIISRIGPTQRLDAIKRGAAAVFGNDPEFRTYQDFRASLAVMIAVASQGSRPSDADVFRASLPMVPDPYNDTAASQQQKWGLIFQMFQTRLSPEIQAELGLSGAGSGLGPKVGDIVTVRGQKVRVTKVLPNGQYDGEPVR